MMFGEAIRKLELFTAADAWDGSRHNVEVCVDLLEHAASEEKRELLRERLQGISGGLTDGPHGVGFHFRPSPEGNAFSLREAIRNAFMEVRPFAGRRILEAGGGKSLVLADFLVSLGAKVDVIEPDTDVKPVKNGDLRMANVGIEDLAGIRRELGVRKGNYDAVCSSHVFVADSIYPKIGLTGDPEREVSEIRKIVENARHTINNLLKIGGVSVHHGVDDSDTRPGLYDVHDDKTMVRLHSCEWDSRICSVSRKVR